MKYFRAFAAVVFISVFAALGCAASAVAQENADSEPAAALSAAITAACRENETQFANYLTADSAAAFHALSADQRTAFLERFSLSSQPSKPLISSDPQNHTVLRCVGPAGSAEFRFGDVRVHENLAFVPVTAVSGEQTSFGLIRENGGWRLLSLGLVLLDIPQLSKQWAESDLASREDAAVENLRGVADAIQTYRRAWGKLPDSLQQMGPALEDEISPEQASLVNEKLAAGSSAGYRFRYRIVPGAQEDEQAFELSAVPEDYGKTGRRSFLLDSSGKIHAADHHGQVATLADSPLP
jgi:type II secretory pathway pseudopilin PulG